MTTSDKASDGETKWERVPTAAERLGVSDRTVWRYIAEGRLPAYRLGKRSVRLRRTDVDALLQPRAEPAA